MDKFKNPKTIYYIGIIFVVLVWGAYPVFTKRLLTLYTPSLWDASASFLSMICLLLANRTKLKWLDWRHIKVALPTGLFFSAAGLTQKFGLTMTTPAMCAFLENLTCVCVPVLMLVFAKQKLTLVKCLAAVLCLGGVFILCGGDLSGGWSLGVILCALAGVFYSVNIAGTGAYAKRLDTGLYLLIQFAVQFVVSTVYSIFFVKEPVYSFNPLHLGALVGIVLLSTVLCWLIRTACLKKLDPSFIAVAMPFSSVVTGALSILFGSDTLSFALVGGAILILVAIIISGLADSKQQ